MAEDDRAKWNEKHGSTAGGKPPSPRLVSALEGDRLRRGRALDVASGSGRHALALARAGFDVLAVDVSDVALETLSKQAAAEELTVRTERRDVEREGLPPGQFDLVVVVNFLDRTLFPALREAVAPGGAIFYETFTLRESEARGFREEFCLREGELLAAFEGFEPLAHEDGELEGRFRESLLARRRE